MTTLKNATAKLILTAKGEVSKNFKNTLWCARFDETTFKIYACQWKGSGRHISCSDKRKAILDVLKAQGYKVEVGNDAPKGGFEGNFIKVSKTAFNFLKQYRTF